MFELDACSRSIEVAPFLLVLAGGVFCRRIERDAHNGRLRGGKINIRVTLPAPRAAEGFENLGGFFDECALLLSCELHHAPAFVWHTKRRENLSRHPEIGMIHV
jgi:hypothetical protein